MNRSDTSGSSHANHFIPGLDGLRAVAVLAVLGYHLLPAVLPGGYIGVDIFFVISGFLITTLLITERTRTGRISFKKFWVRRARRLLPALFAVIAVVSAVALFVRGDILVGIGRQILGALTFSNNWMEVAAGSNYFDAVNTHLFTNFWSLAVEEQFYLAWPFVVALLIGVSWFAVRSKVAMVVTVLLAASSAVLMAHMFNGDNMTRVYYGTDTHLFGLMIGATLAFWTRTKTAPGALRRLSQPFWWWAHKKRVQLFGVMSFAGLVVILFTMPDLAPFTYYGGLVLTSVLAAGIIVATVSGHGLLRWLFTRRVLEWIGKRSYGIYLWHWPLLVLFGRALPSTVPDWIVPCITLAATCAVAATSYRYIEIPIQRQGFRAFMSKAVWRRAIVAGKAAPRWKLLPHPMLIPVLAVIGLGVGAVISAPPKTQAQLRVEAGQQAINRHAPASEPPTQRVAGIQSQPPQLPPPKSTPLSGADMTVIGDSVTIASAPALQARFPGILIDAEISRSTRRGGQAAIQAHLAAGDMRRVAVIALGTNDYFGTGNLDKLVAELGDRRIIFVTAHADREWTVPNNDDVHRAAQKYPNVSVAEWDAAVSAHPEVLGEDGIHPGAQGSTMYADCIAKALNL